MNVGSLRIGPLVISAPSSWSFFPATNMVLGRPDSRHGTLQISTAYSVEGGSEFDESACIAALSEFSDESISAMTPHPVDHGVLQSVDIPTSKTFKRYWIRFVDGLLVLAVYQCSSSAREDADAELKEAGTIVGTSHPAEAA